MILKENWFTQLKKEAYYYQNSLAWLGSWANKKFISALLFRNETVSALKHQTTSDSVSALTLSDVV